MATAIIAFALAAIIQTTASSTANLVYLRDKTFAHWVAMNHMEDLEATRSYPRIGRSNGSETLAGHEWFWFAEVKETPDPDIRRVEISVRSDERGEGSPLASLTGFFTKTEPVETPTP